MAVSVGERIVTVVSSSKLGSKSMSSDASVSSESGHDPGAGDNGLAFAFLPCLPFLGIMELAQDLTLRGLRVALREAGLVFTASPTTSSFSIAGDTNGELEDLEREGSDRLVGIIGTELSLRFDSSRKKPRRLAGIRAELEAAVGEVGDTADMGRLRSEG
jgi:hypothetical protein